MNIAHAFPDTADRFLSPFHGTTLPELLATLISILMYILFPLVVMMIVYTGFLFVTAQGNPAKIQKARSALVWTLIGGLIILGAQAFSIMIEATVDSMTP